MSLLSQNVLKSDVKKSQMCQIWCDSGQIGCGICHSCHGGEVSWGGRTLVKINLTNLAQLSSLDKLASVIFPCVYLFSNRKSRGKWRGDVRFRPKVDQIGPKLDKSWTFFDQNSEPKYTEFWYDKVPYRSHLGQSGHPVLRHFIWIIEIEKKVNDLIWFFFFIKLFITW